MVTILLFLLLFAATVVTLLIAGTFILFRDDEITDDYRKHSMRDYQ